MDPQPSTPSLTSGSSSVSAGKSNPRLPLPQGANEKIVTAHQMRMNPVRQLGISGVSVPPSQTCRKIFDKRYYVQQVNNHIIIIDKEISKLHEQLIQHKLQSTNFECFERKVTDLRKHFEEKDEYLKILNDVVRLHYLHKGKTIDVSKNIAMLRKANKERMDDMERIQFFDRKDLERIADTLRRELNQEKLIKEEMINALSAEGKEELEELTFTKDELLDENEALNTELDVVKSDINRFRAKMSKDPKLITKYKLKTLITEAPEISEKYKTENKQLKTFEKEAEIIQLEIETLGTIVEKLESDMSVDYSEQIRRFAKFREFKRREKIMENFLLNYSNIARDTFEQMSDVQSRIAYGLEFLSATDEEKDPLWDPEEYEYYINPNLSKDAIVQIVIKLQKQCIWFRHTLDHFRIEINELLKLNRRYGDEIDIFTNYEDIRDEMIDRQTELATLKASLTRSLESTSAAIVEATANKQEVDKKIQSDPAYSLYQELQAKLIKLEEKNEKINEAIAQVFVGNEVASVQHDCLDYMEEMQTDLMKKTEDNFSFIEIVEYKMSAVKNAEEDNESMVAKHIRFFECGTLEPITYREFPESLKKISPITNNTSPAHKKSKPKIIIPARKTYIVISDDESSSDISNGKPTVDPSIEVQATDSSQKKRVSSTQKVTPKEHVSSAQKITQVERVSSGQKLTPKERVLSAPKATQKERISSVRKDLRKDFINSEIEDQKQLEQKSDILQEHLTSVKNDISKEFEIIASEPSSISKISIKHSPIMAKLDKIEKKQQALPKATTSYDIQELYKSDALAQPLHSFPRANIFNKDSRIKTTMSKDSCITKQKNRRFSAYGIKIREQMDNDESSTNLREEIYIAEQLELTEEEVSPIFPKHGVCLSPVKEESEKLDETESESENNIQEDMKQEITDENEPDSEDTDSEEIDVKFQDNENAEYVSSKSAGNDNNIDDFVQKNQSTESDEESSNTSSSHSKHSHFVQFAESQDIGLKTPGSARSSAIDEIVTEFSLHSKENSESDGSSSESKETASESSKHNVADSKSFSVKYPSFKKKDPAYISPCDSKAPFSMEDHISIISGEMKEEFGEIKIKRRFIPIRKFVEVHSDVDSEPEPILVKSPMNPHEKDKAKMPSSSDVSSHEDEANFALPTFEETTSNNPDFQNTLLDSPEKTSSESSEINEAPTNSPNLTNTPPSSTDLGTTPPSSPDFDKIVPASSDLGKISPVSPDLVEIQLVPPDFIEAQPISDLRKTSELPFNLEKPLTPTSDAEKTPSESSDLEKMPSESFNSEKTPSESSDSEEIPSESSQKVSSDSSDSEKSPPRTPNLDIPTTMQLEKTPSISSNTKISSASSHNSEKSSLSPDLNLPLLAPEDINKLPAAPLELDKSPLVSDMETSSPTSSDLEKPLSATDLKKSSDEIDTEDSSTSDEESEY